MRKYLFLLLTGLYLLAPSFASASWWNNSWAHKQTLTHVNATSSAVVANYNGLIVITSSTFASMGCQSNGADIRVVDANDTTEINHEIEVATSSANNSYVWYQKPSLATSGTDTVNWYCGNPSALDDSTSSTWDSNYVAVYHFATSSGAVSYKDSSQVGNTAINNGTVATTSIIGTGIQLDGASQYVQCATSSFPTGNSDYTIDALMFTSSTAPLFQKVVTYGNQLVTDQGVFFGIVGGGSIDVDHWADDFTYNSATTSASTWYGLETNHTGGQDSVFINGNLRQQHNPAGTLNIVQNYCNIGAIFANNAIKNFFGGVIDEVRVSKIQRSTSTIYDDYLGETNGMLSYGAVQSNTCAWTHFSTSWANCQTITLTNRASSTAQAIALPVILSSSSISMAKLKADGSDIRIVSSTDDTTVASEYMESFVGNQGTSTLWVNPGAIPTGVSVWSMYYNNPSAPNIFSSTSTFPTSTYALAANLTDAATSSIKDDTGYANNGKSTMTNLNATSSQCWLSGCEQAATQFITFPSSTSMGLVANTSSTGNTSGTISMWASLTGTSTFFGKSDNNVTTGWEFDHTQTGGTAMAASMVYSATDARRNVNQNVINAGWHFWTVTMDTTLLASSSIHIYKDGAEVAYSSGQAPTGSQGDHTTLPFFVGHTTYAGNNADAKGFFDEVETLPVILSTSTILFQYQTQANQAITFGTEQNAPAAPVVVQSRRRRMILISEW